MSQALGSMKGTDPLKYGALWRSAKYRVWLSYHSDRKAEISRFALEAIGFCEKAVRADENRAEGYYYRAIATGLYAEQNKLKSRDAMKRIERDALRAIELDAALSHGGPHRLLGALYLRAPGPPTGVGSLRRASQHIRQAVQLAPDYPENLLFLAELHLKSRNRQEAQRLVEQVLSSSHPGGDLLGPDDLRQQALELQLRLAKD